jgi:AcrR family transcriptional regulator
MPRRRITRVQSQAETRARVLAAAARVFACHGYHGASISEIADEAGYSHGAVYSNFADKQDLFMALYEEWVARRVAEINAERGAASTAAGIDAERPGASTVAERARVGVEEWLRRLAADPDPFLLRLEFTARGVRDPDLRRKLGARVGAVPLALQRLTERDAEAEGLELALPADEVVLALQALSLGLALESLGNPGAVRAGLGGELAARLIEALTVRSGSRV